MKNRLLWKLIGINIVVIATVILVVWWAIDYLAAGYFTTLMDQYHIAPEQANSMFLDAIHRYLLWGSLLALALSLILCVLLTRRVLRPLSRMAEATRRLAAGDYSARAGLEGQDEVARLGQAFDQMASTLAHVEQLREQMVSDAAHELRTPLTTIQGYLEAMRDGVMPPSHETLSMLHDEVLRLAKLAESLLSLARADVAGEDMKPELLSLRRLLDEALELGRPVLAARHLRIEQVLDPSADRVWADPDKVRQVLRNLIENVGHYATDGGLLRVRLEPQDGGVRLTLSNDGETFPPEDAPFVFERFYRGDRARSQGRGLAGLGLAIVKELVEAHGGEVGARCGKGETQIWLTLPGPPSDATHLERPAEWTVATAAKR